MIKSKNRCIYGHFSFYKKSKANNTGITLIALVITVIVLLILARGNN